MCIAQDAHARSYVTCFLSLSACHRFRRLVIARHTNLYLVLFLMLYTLPVSYPFLFIPLFGPITYPASCPKLHASCFFLHGWQNVCIYELIRFRFVPYFVYAVIEPVCYA